MDSTVTYSHYKAELPLKRKTFVSNHEGQFVGSQPCTNRIMCRVNTIWPLSWYGFWPMKLDFEWRHKLSLMLLPMEDQFILQPCVEEPPGSFVKVVSLRHVIALSWVFCHPWTIIVSVPGKVSTFHFFFHFISKCHRQVWSCHVGERVAWSKLT